MLLLLVHALCTYGAVCRGLRVQTGGVGPAEPRQGICIHCQDKSPPYSRMERVCTAVFGSFGCSTPSLSLFLSEPPHPPPPPSPSPFILPSTTKNNNKPQQQQQQQPSSTLCASASVSVFLPSISSVSSTSPWRR